MMRRAVWFGFVLCVVCVTGMAVPPWSAPAFARPGAAGAAGYIPPELERWSEWALHDKEEYLCPSSYADGGLHMCFWPSRLQLDLDPEGGTFSQEWLAFDSGWIPLPGDGEAWPQDVTVNGKSAPLVSRQGMPHTYVSPGRHRIKGAFFWGQMPETLRIPEASGLVGLTIDRRSVEFPLLEADGRLWLQKRRDAAGRENRLDVSIYRLITDSIPMQVTNLVRINCSGQMREVKLDGVLLDGAAPMNVRSPIPARLGRDGTLTLQARPGRFEVYIDSRLQGPVHELGPARAPFGTETWAFESQNHLRMVQIEGVPATDPGQTDVPLEWKEFSVYIVEPDSRVFFRENRRGDPDPAPDRLDLQRTLWLDFDGKGFTAHDRIGGTVSRQWFIAMNPPMVLGRASIDGVDQLITNHGSDRDNPKAGVELRKGRIDLSADSRIEGPLRTIPAIGWDHDMQSASATLNLPPGWRIFAASGADHVPGTWIERWTLLDLFLSLLIAIAVSQLWGRTWGILALATLVLTYHEPGAPRIAWLSLIAATALLRFLPEGRLKRCVNAWRIAAVAVLIMICIPFMIRQVRWGLHPQLEPSRIQADSSIMGGFDGFFGPVAKMAPPAPSMPPVPESSNRIMQKTEPSTGAPEQNADEPDIYSRKQKRAALARDPKALIQTGPGLPAWQWRSFVMRWSGPVARDQQVRLWLIPPAGNLALNFLRVLLLGLLAAGLTGALPSRFSGLRGARSLPGAPGSTGGGASAALMSALLTAAAVLLFSGAAMGTVGPAEDAETKRNGNAREHSGGALFPPRELLEELETRLLEPPECLPNCAESPRMHLALGSDAISVLFEVHAAVRTAVPLPGNTKAWLPERIAVDGPGGNSARTAGTEGETGAGTETDAQTVSRDREGLLWVTVPEGVHRIHISGRVPPGGAGSGIQLFLPLRPHFVKVEDSTGGGWDIQGVHPDGQVEPGIQLVRRDDETAPGSARESGSGESALSPFLHVERTLMLGLDWRVHTVVRRMTPPGDPIAAAIPLIEGESVTTSRVRVEKGHVLVHMVPGAQTFEWESTLEMSPAIHLKAPEGADGTMWTETWVLDAGPIWRCEPAGIPVIHHQDDAGYWKPTWKPWPGEAVTIAVSRPEVIPGQVLTIDSARLEWTPGQRLDKGELTLKMRSSQGGQHKILLPEGAALQVLKIKGKEQPVSSGPAEPAEPTEPVEPGGPAGPSGATGSTGAAVTTGAAGEPDGGRGREVTIPLQPGSREVYMEWRGEAGSRLLMRSPEVDLGRRAVNADVTFTMPRNVWILWTSGPSMGPAVLCWNYLVVVILGAAALGRAPWTPLKTRHWVLLGLGIIQLHPAVAVIIAGWLPALGFRRRHAFGPGWFRFDMAQLALAAWTAAALGCLYFAVKEGLLGIPHMQIAGNNSTALSLHWTMDRVDSAMPRPWALTVPIYVYRVLMLLWALWLAQALLGWLRWGWECVSEGGLWRFPPPGKAKKAGSTEPALPDRPA